MLRLVSKRILGAASRDEPALQVLPRFYHDRVVGSFDKNDHTVGTGLVGAPASDDVMKLQIKVEEKNGKMVDACFKTFGCGSAIASSSVGKQMQGVLSIKNIDFVKHLSSHPFKLHRPMFAEDAIKAGVKSYEARRGLATAAEATSGETAATPVMAPVTNRLRPISPHLSIYKPQSSSMTSFLIESRVLP